MKSLTTSRMVDMVLEVDSLVSVLCGSDRVFMFVCHLHITGLDVLLQMKDNGSTWISILCLGTSSTLFGSFQFLYLEMVMAGMISFSPV